MKQDGLTVEGPDESFVVRPVEATDNPEEIGPVDFVLFAVKLWDVEPAGIACRPMIGPDTAVISLQNGVDCEGQLCALLGEKHVMGGAAEISSTIAGPGHIKRISPLAMMRFGELDGQRSSRSKRLADAFTHSGIDFDHSEDIVSALWGKFVFLVGLSALTAITRRPIGSVRTDPDTRALLQQIMEEALAVGKAKGVPIGDEVISERMQLIDDIPAEVRASMAVDLEHGKRLELPWLSGAVVRLGNELSVPTPANSFAYTTLKLNAEGWDPATA